MKVAMNVATAAATFSKINCNNISEIVATIYGAYIKISNAEQFW